MGSFIRLFEPSMSLEIKVVTLNKEGNVVKEPESDGDEDKNSLISEEIVDVMLHDYSSEVLEEYLEEYAQINTDPSKLLKGQGALKFKKNISNELKK